MSVKVSTWAWHEAPQEIGGNELVVLLALADIANDAGEVVFASEDESRQVVLARKARVSKATFKRQIESLRDRGVLSIEREGLFGVNRYRLVTGAQIEPPSGLTGEPSRGSVVSPRSSSLRSDVFDAPQRGSRLPDEWALSDALRAWTEERTPSVNVEDQVERFRDYWVSVSGQRAVKRDWNAAWRLWAKRAHDDAVRAGWRPQLRAVEGAEWMTR